MFKLIGVFAFVCALASFSGSPAHAELDVPSDEGEQMAVPDAVAEDPEGDLARDNGSEEQDADSIYSDIHATFMLNRSLRGAEFTPDEMESLLFTLWQHSLLREAKRLYQHATTRAPDPSEIRRAEQGGEMAPRPRGLREISLAGILYHGSENWVIWLNGQRVTPDALPKEVMDIKVHNDHIEVRWFDAYTNLIYPVKMRAHQRFNLDSRIFLPGTQVSAR